ncbi:hypothetical protein [Actinoallomurus iriomotensis]|uniref:Uncharacterized protein n=1 Tax=Actinoallomurus iriomotensis TaxID=478107 RepID=A0A9W6RG45_9ACTN|nr:hypothetical protein [Actinoallomurus iriomotensis]GLY75481.1 hypothetical protein Airi01_037480 [Actinoallomurus iriomotensis]
MEAFVELVGGLASGDVIGGTPESVADELVGGAEALAEAADRSGTSSGELHAKPVVANAMAESANLQAEILLGAEATPLLPDGLVSTSDGLHWTYPRASPAPR